MKRQNRTVLIGAVAAMLVLALAVAGITAMLKSNVDSSGTLSGSGKDLAALVKDMENRKYGINEAVKSMGQISMSENTLYDELPEITKYPIQVQGRGQIDIEIFTSGEKAGKNHDAWLVECAEDFNKSNAALADGRTVSLTVRSIASGLGADYILSGKYLPDLYTPSNPLFGDYAIANGAPMELLSDRLVGNTAGILVRKGSGYKAPDQVVAAVIAGELHLGYTNPQTSATGANLLLYLLQSNGGVDSEQAAEALKNFNGNVPYIAYTTQQMVTSAASGSFDAIVSEYQAYVNDENLKSLYEYIPFGIRHDNPVYITGKAGSDAARTEACGIILDYLTDRSCQDRASRYGFNAMEDYESDMAVYGAETGRALQVYKKAKDAGKDIIAVFVADCSGSMDGTKLLELKQSLSNGMQYINENNLIGLVSYSDEVTVELPIARFDMNQKAYFQGAVDRMQANGNTYSYEAVCVGLDMIRTARQDNPDAKAMLFLLSDGQANGRFSLKDISYAVREESVPVYTIAYTGGSDSDQLSQLSGINEAACIKADSDDIVYQIKNLFNSQL